MEANEMESGTRDEGGQALEEFQRGYDEMGRAIAIRDFELEDDLTGRGAAQACVAEGGTDDIATQLFEFLSLLGAAIGLRMQIEPLRELYSKVVHGVENTRRLGLKWVLQDIHTSTTQERRHDARAYQIRGRRSKEGPIR